MRARESTSRRAKRPTPARALLVASIAGLAVASAVVTTPASAEPADPLGWERGQGRAPEKLMELDLGFTKGQMRLERSDAPFAMGRRSFAGRAIDPRIARAAAPGAEYVVTSRVIIQLAPGTDTGPEQLAAALGEAGLEFETLPVRGRFVIVDLPTVEDAAGAASVLRGVEGVRRAHLDAQQPRTLRALPTDPLVIDQWHLFNDQNIGIDLNVEPAWAAGYTGAGVDIGIVEGGWQLDHPDLSPNHNDTVTMPGSIDSSHATAVAGIAGAAADNGIGGVGVAFGANISAQIYGTASQDAAALLHANDIIDVKNNSWGPIDIGTYWTIAPVQSQALADAAQLGRGGLGTVLVWSGGNGRLADRVEFDPWASSRFTIAVGGIDEGDDRASYSEPGSALHVVAPSSGTGRPIVTTTSGDGYITDFGATSAAAPMVSGTVALMLQANPSLSYRDVQQILIDTARKNDSASDGWRTNGAGRDIHYDYGFGAVDASAAVAAAETWSNLAPEAVVSSGVVTVNDNPPGGSAVGINASVEIPDGIVIEHVELVMDCQISRPEDLTISLLSPAGTESVLAKGRLASRIRPSDADLDDYVLTSARHWGESSAGSWTVTVADLLVDEPTLWRGFELRFYGTPIAGVCNADFDGSGTPDSEDISAFVGAWFALDESADLTTTNSNPGDAGYLLPDANIDGADLASFVECWLAAQV